MATLFKNVKYNHQGLIRFDAEQMSRVKYGHALPENWEQLDYREFLSQRRKRNAKVVDEAFEKL